MRHSLPSPIRHSFPEATLGELSWGRMAELAASERLSPEPATPRRAHQDIRMRRSKLSGDFGVNLLFNGAESSRRSQSCSSKAAIVSDMSLASPALDFAKAPLSQKTVGESSSQAVDVSMPQRRSARCDSMPPIGTSKADIDAAAHAKARAVATLQRLFFEEMAKGSEDASGAAAKALLRLSQAPQELAAAEPRIAATSSKARLQPPAEIEIPLEAPEPEAKAPPASSCDILAQQVAALAARPVVPRRPAHDENIGMAPGRRRPRPASRVAVRS